MDEARQKRVRGLMGLCVRARQAVFGEDGCLKLVRAGECGLLLVDAGASAATRDKYRGACRSAETPMVTLPEGLLSEATGRPGRAMAVRRGGLAKQLAGLIGDQTNESENHGGGASV